MDAKTFLKDNYPELNKKLESMTRRGLVCGIMQDYAYERDKDDPNDRTAIDKLIEKYEKAAKSAEATTFVGIYGMFVKELKQSRAEL